MQEAKVKTGGCTPNLLFTLFPHLQHVMSGKEDYPDAELCPQSRNWRGHIKREVEGVV